MIKTNLDNNKKDIVSASVCVYDFDNSKYRYVFFFYRNGETKPIHKWIYYLIDNNVDDFKEKYFEEIKVHNFAVDENITLFMCTKDTSLNIIRVPNNFKYRLLAHKIIEDDLRDRFGSDVGEKFFIDNTVVENYQKGEEGNKFTKIQKSSVITYQQILVPRDLLHVTRVNLSKLNLFMKSLKSLPSALYKYHLNETKFDNELVIYNEANFTVIIGFANNKIIDNIFIEGSNKLKNGDGEIINLHLHKISNVVASLLWNSQKEGAIIENATLISNSARNIELITKKENIFGMKFDIVNLTDSIFGDIISEQSEENNDKTNINKIKNGFSLVEVVTSIAVLSIVLSVVAGIMAAVSSFNKSSLDKSKINVYLDNVREVINNIDEDKILNKLTGYTLEDGEKELENVYFINYNAELAPMNESSNGYKVNFKFQKISLDELHNQYSFTISSIQTVKNDKLIVSNVLFEVIK